MEDIFGMVLASIEWAFAQTVKFEVLGINVLSVAMAGFVIFCFFKYILEPLLGISFGIDGIASSAYHEKGDDVQESENVIFVNGNFGSRIRRVRRGNNTTTYIQKPDRRGK